MDAQSEVLQRLTRVETKMDGMDSKLDRAINANETAVEALASARSAHHRIDKIDKLINWVGTTIIGAIILAIIGFAIKGGFASNG